MKCYVGPSVAFALISDKQGIVDEVIFMGRQAENSGGRKMTDFIP